MADEVKGQDARPSDALGFLNLGEGWIPLDWVILVKCITPDGSVRYREMLSKTLHPVEALGMATTFEDTMRTRLMSNIEPG